MALLICGSAKIFAKTKAMMPLSRPASAPRVMTRRSTREAAALVAGEAEEVPRVVGPHSCTIMLLPNTEVMPSSTPMK